MMRGMHTEMVNWGVDLFERFKRIPSTPPVALLNCIGIGFGALGRFSDAKIVYDLILTYYEDKLADTDLTAIQYNLARLYLDMGEVLKATEYCKMVVENNEQQGNKRGFTLGLNLLADILWENNQYAEGLQVMQRALKIAQEIGNAHMIANMTSDLARHMDDQHDPKEIVSVYEEAIRLLTERHDEVGLARTYRNYAVLCHKNGWDEKAYALADLSMEIYERYNLAEQQEITQMVAEWQSQVTKL